MTKANPAIVSGTEIAAGDARTRYDRIAVTLHWLTVLLVLAQFGLAQFWGFAPKPAHHLMIVAHMSFGILLTLVLMMRIVWQLVPSHRMPPAIPGWMGLAARALHYLLYGLLAGEVVLGFLLRWSGNEPLSFFGLLIPSPIPPFSKSAHHLVGETHNFIAWTIIVLASAHALTALFHHFVLRDGVLRRMLPTGLMR